MRKGVRARLTYANVTATLALTLALGGGIAAASGVIITSPSQVGDNVIASGNVIDGTLLGTDLSPATVGIGQLAPSSVTTANIVDGTVQPADLARWPTAVVHRSTDLLVRSGGAWLQWSTAEIADPGMWTRTYPSRLTAPRAGRYEVVANAGWTGESTDPEWSGYASISLYVNGTRTVASSTEPVVANNVAFAEQSLTRVLSLDQGDYVQVRASQTANPAGMTIDGDRGSAAGASLSLRFLGS